MAFEYTDKEKREIAENSLERVINTTLKLLNHLEGIGASRGLPNDIQEDLSINLQDWKELKPIAVKVWDDKRDEHFRLSLEK